MWVLKSGFRDAAEVRREAETRRLEWAASPWVHVPTKVHDGVSVAATVRRDRRAQLDHS